VGKVSGGQATCQHRRRQDLGQPFPILRDSQLASVSSKGWLGESYFVVVTITPFEDKARDCEVVWQRLAGIRWKKTGGQCTIEGYLRRSFLSRRGMAIEARNTTSTTLEVF
jgi:hypothetical protein